MGIVSIQLQGGLCNYMFQISAAYAYSLKYNKELLLTTDDAVVIHKAIDNYRDNILHNVKFVNSASRKDFITYNEPGFDYTPIPETNYNIHLNGYFQSELYFNEYRKEIIDLFSYPNSTKEKYAELLSKNTCFIHCRRGDYLTKPEHHPPQTLNYYMKAIKKMPKDSVFVVFSDDIQWCKDNFPNIEDKFVFIEGNSDVEDFTLMTLCNNGIITNSTYSWWAAYLNDNPSKKIISPSYLKWFGPASSHLNTKDLIPKNYIQQ